MTNDELELLASARNGDQTAINKVFLDNNSIVWQIAKKYFLAGGDIDDLVQEGRFGLYKAINIFDPNKCDNFSNFAGKVIEREIINAIRKENTNKNMVLDKSILADDEFLQSNSNPEQDVILAERFEYIKEKMFSKLSDFEKKVFDYYLQEYSYLDIAKFLDKSPKAIDNALTRIKLKLASIKEKLWVIQHYTENIGHKHLTR